MNELIKRIDREDDYQKQTELEIHTKTLWVSVEIRVQKKDTHGGLHEKGDVSLNQSATGKMDIANAKLVAELTTEAIKVAEELKASVL